MAQSLPNNLEAEQAILSAMLASPQNAAKAVEELKPEDFFLGCKQGNPFGFAGIK